MAGISKYCPTIEIVYIVLEHVLENVLQILLCRVYSWLLFEDLYAPL